MSFTSLLDHVVRVWRPATSLGALREEKRSHVLVGPAPVEPNAVLSQLRIPYADTGPGLMPTGTRDVLMTIETDVAALDILEVVSGPEAPALFEVNEQPMRPRGHHVELRVRPWHGTLPVEGS